MNLDEEENSIWWFDVLNTIGADDVYRKARKQAGITGEILESFLYPLTRFNMGSTIEGTAIPGAPSDRDVIMCDKRFSVIENIADAIRNKEVLFSLLMVPEEDTPGYVKLQLINEDIPNTSEHWTILYENNKHLLKKDQNNRLFLSERTILACPEYFERTENKPADLTVGKFSNLKTDTVITYRGKTWPTMANEWSLRDRQNGWLTQEKIKELKSLGFFVVKKANSPLQDKDLEWRISLSLQERQLVFNFTDVQYKCYVTLKMLNRDVINLDCITTYHWKTCIFYAIEENDENIWGKKMLWYCIKLCIKQMLKWVKMRCCPNYFIPGENLFVGRLNSDNQQEAETSLEDILNLGFNCLLSVKKNRILDYVKSRKSHECSQQLRKESSIVYKEALCTAEISIMEDVISVFNQDILEHFSNEANENTLTLINSLTKTLKRIQHYTCNYITAEHTPLEIKQSLSFLLPSIYTCLAGNISTKAVRNSNPQIRDFLFLGSYVYFMKGGLPGRLKFISVLFAAELYNDCKWYIDREDEVYIENTPSLCRCRYIKNDQFMASTNILNTSSLDVSTCMTCVSFLPTELLITPDAMKYEMFRHIGISLDEDEKTDVFGRWNYRAIVDSNVYFFLLKYLIKGKVVKVKECEKAITNINRLLFGTNLRHRDVACNVLVWIFCSEFNIPEALLFFDVVMEDNAFYRFTSYDKNRHIETKAISIQCSKNLFVGYMVQHMVCKKAVQRPILLSVLLYNHWKSAQM